MNKIIPLLTVFMLTSAANAVEYKSENFDKYGYGSAASVIQDSGLKGGLRGSHVAANHHTENAYYPGYHAVHNNDDK